ncbi:MAG: dUTP diphosphatase [Hyphomicrobiales bacterium]|nr:dUTP diphosphatase [Hyphomicrobiales bacterium]MCY4053095.1 dUTP diphosphatase [Hyphomicrobiales bacterium]
MIDVGIRRLPHGEGLPLPAYHSKGAAGMDLHAAVDAAVSLRPRARACVPTGIAIALPQGHEAQIRPRSGLARKHGISVLNAPGTIDSDYRGELQVLLVNHGDEVFEITRGMRIAQLVLARVERIEWVAQFDATSARGDKGFGSTGSGMTGGDVPLAASNRESGS